LAGRVFAAVTSTSLDILLVQAVRQQRSSSCRTTAAAITRLVEAGARLVGRTQMDERAYGVLGENAHYGTPRKPAAPDRVPGGSSSGSGSAVAAAWSTSRSGATPPVLCDCPPPSVGSLVSDLPWVGYRRTGCCPSRPVLIPLDGSLALRNSCSRLAASSWMPAQHARVLLRSLIAEDALHSPSHASHKPTTRCGDHRCSLQRGSTVRIVEADAQCGLAWLWFRVWSMQVREVGTIHGDWILQTKPDSTVLSRNTGDRSDLHSS
jgi:hypothetical protein